MLMIRWINQRAPDQRTSPFGLYNTEFAKWSAKAGIELRLYSLSAVETGLTVMAAAVSLFSFSLLPQHLDSVHQPGHPAHPGRAEAPGAHSLTQDFFHLRAVTVSFIVDCLHDLHVSFILPFGIPERIFKVFFCNKGDSGRDMKNGIYPGGRLTYRDAALTDDMR